MMATGAILPQAEFEYILKIKTISQNFFYIFYFISNNIIEQLIE